MARLAFIVLVLTWAILVHVEGIGFNVHPDERTIQSLPSNVKPFGINQVRMSLNRSSADLVCRYWNSSSNASTTMLALRIAVDIPNEYVSMFAANETALDQWFTDVVRYLDRSRFVIRYIIVGNEMIPGPTAKDVITVIKAVRSFFAPALSFTVTTSVGASVLGASYPPSTTEFAANASSDMKELLHVLSDGPEALLMINIYPYYAYAADPDHVPLDYAIFNATAPVVHDGDLAYYNLFDAMVDSFYWAMEKAGYPYPEILIKVSETGWPHTNPEVAETYNKNLAKGMAKRWGTPKLPYQGLEAYIYAYNDWPHDSFGLFNPDGVPYYQFP